MMCDPLRGDGGERVRMGDQTIEACATASITHR